MKMLSGEGAGSVRATRFTPNEGAAVLDAPGRGLS